MKRYRVQIHRSGDKFLKHVPKADAELIRAEIDGLGDNPMPDKSLKLTDRNPPQWPHRVGRYRIIYQFFKDEQLLWVQEVDKRHEGTYG